MERVDLTRCRTHECDGERVLYSDLCRDCLRFTWKHGRRPDDVSPFLRRVADHTVPTLVVGGTPR